MPDRDVTFTFDPNPFRRGIDAVNRGLSGMESTAGGVAKGMTRALSGLATKVVGLVGVFGALRAAWRSMPELGQVFGMAGEVIKQNLLWPIRQALMPALQGILDWVRDNRALFAQWGQGLLGVLRGAWEIAKTLWQALRGIMATMRELLGNVFPFLNRSIQDTLNLLQFKMVLTAKILGDIFESVAEFWQDSGLQALWREMVAVVVDIVEASAKLAAAFGAGFASRIEGVKDAFSGVVDSVRNLLDAIFGGGDGQGLERATEIMERLGAWAASGVAVALDTVAALVNSLAQGIRDLKEAIGNGDWVGVLERLPVLGPILEGIRETREEGGGFGQGLRNVGESFLERTPIPAIVDSIENRFGGQEVDDALIRPDGEVVRFDPADTIIATKSPGALAGGATVNIDMSGAQFVVTEGDAEAAGANFAAGLGGRLRDMLLEDMTRAGD